MNVKLQESETIHQDALRHLQNMLDFTGNRDPMVHCVAGVGGGYGPANPQSYFWAWGSGFDEGFNLSLIIEDVDGNALSPQPAVQTVPVLGGGLFTTTFLWTRHPVASYGGLGAPVLHVRSTDFVDGWAPLRVEDVYIAQS